MRFFFWAFMFCFWNLMMINAQTNRLLGVITDERNEAIDGVQVVLSAGDSLVALALTDKRGHYVMEDLRSGYYQLNIHFMGYNSIEDSVMITGQEVRKDYLLTPELNVNLEEVTVTGNRADQVTRTATGEIFHLSEKAKASGDPFLALREVPRLYSDMANRQILMADGERPLILVNGNRFHQDIAAIDPKEIESVEIIDVVKARYLKDGYQKIVNIKLKRKAAPFIYWEVATRHNVPWRKGLGVAYFEVGNTRFALYGRAVYNYLHNERADMDQTQSNVGYQKRQIGTTRQDGYDYLGELQFRWMATDKDYLVAHVYGKKIKTEDQGQGEGILMEREGRPFSYETMDNDDSYVITASLFHKHSFSESSVLETTLAYNKNRNETDGRRQETYFDDYSENYYLYNNQRHSGRLDIDYSLDLTNGASLAVGSQTRFTNDRIHQVSDHLPLFKHRRWDEYFYADYTHRLGDLSYMLSAGAEGIWLRAGDADNHYFRPRVSLSGTYDFSDHFSARFGYQLGNTSPDISQLNPYNLSTDSLTRTAGNPYLMPSRDHEWSLSSTYNLKGLYLSPSVRYRLSDDGVEAYGYNDENGIYVSTYRNSRRVANLRLGGNLSYRLGDWGYAGIYGYHLVDYFTGQLPKKAFQCGLSVNGMIKKWYFGADVIYTNYEYTALSRKTYRVPSFSMFQVSYYFTKDFYISAAIENTLGYLRAITDYQDGAYSSRTDLRQISASFSPWILIRYTFRKNRGKQMRERQRVDALEEGIRL